MSWLHPSGGLVYHLRAWRHGKGLWRPFHDQVRQWLSRWRPAESHLVLVGPSGGYALDLAFLSRFDRVTALEPDGLARFILSRRFPGLGIRFNSDFQVARPQGFTRLAQAYPDAAFLFCNLLGQQLVGQRADFQRRAWLGDMAGDLAGRTWASWHDLASAHRAPDGRDCLRLEKSEPLEDVLGHFWQGGELAIHDHEVGGLVPALPREYALWQLRPGQYHLVEWLASTPDGGEELAFVLRLPKVLSGKCR
ncbi:MAG: hypothetical protein H6935_02865 [Thiobacillus sp.]|nr:hypothetical protein [Thiobacillus sp.]